MKFCEKCGFKYYISINNNELVNFCRSCGFKDSTLLNIGGNCLLETNFKKKKQNFNHIINKYTKLDPCLPHIYNIKCPNENCKTVKNDVIYFRYNDDDLKYLYICVNCDTTWKTDS
jgi:DNA-directed RNA polymerase subunit M/transcription elongation factor TFIIS